MHKFTLASDFTAAFDHLRRGVKLSLNLAYNEPWGQMQPVRHILGALLHEQGEIKEAEAVYRADIKLWKDNMWGLLGLKLCHEARGDAPEELAEVTRVIRIGKFDALFGAGFKQAQKEAAVSCFLLIIASLVNSNRKVFSDTNPAAGSAISP